MAGTTGLETDHAHLQYSNITETKISQNPAESDTSKDNALPGKDKSASTSDTSEQGKDTLLHKKCATGVHDNSLQLAPELELLIEAWPDLSNEVRNRIMAIIKRKEKRK